MEERNNGLPELNKEIFICPHCKILSRYKWNSEYSLKEQTINIMNHFLLEKRSAMGSSEEGYINNFIYFIETQMPNHLLLNTKLSFSQCNLCRKIAIWVDKKMVYPRVSLLPEPNEDMNDEIKELYKEASNIFRDSPRASAALLRLCIDKLCEQLGEKEKNLNDKIKNLVKKGLDLRIQQALDYCRVIGNNALHPGQIDVKENPEQVKNLFSVVNDIAQQMITYPREMNERYLSLPKDDLKKIEKRDNQNNPQNQE